MKFGKVFKKIFCIAALVIIGIITGNVYAQKQKVILDFDFGSDLDDAYALALLLSSPEVDLIGVVTGYGSTAKRAQGACKFLYDAGRDDIPVAVGRETHTNYFYQYYWSEGFTKYKPIETSGRDFIIETLYKYPNEVIIITVGPVTNMGDVIDKDPDALNLAKQIYSLFGSGYTTGENPTPKAEWNARADVEASKKFVSAGVHVFYTGLDIYPKVRLTEEYRKRMSLRNSPITNNMDALYTLYRYERWGSDNPHLADALSVGMLFWPDLYKTRKAHKKVIDGGYTVIDESKEPNCTITVSVDIEEFLKRFTERLIIQNLSRE